MTAIERLHYLSDDQLQAVLQMLAGDELSPEVQAARRRFLNPGPTTTQETTSHDQPPLGSAASTPDHPTRPDPAVDDHRPRS